MNDDLIKHAIKMRENSYAPFSNYHVGAALKLKSGKIIGGCNVESSSYGLTCCAERVVLYRAISEGYNDFISLAIATENGGMPCGACRQIIWELCENIPIHICDLNGLIKTVYTEDLLPYAFDKKSLL